MNQTTASGGFNSAMNKPSKASSGLGFDAEDAEDAIAMELDMLNNGGDDTAANGPGAPGQAA